VEGSAVSLPRRSLRPEYDFFKNGDIFCVNTGCIPTKTLVASAHAAHTARRGAEYGFSVNGDVRVDMKRVKARKDEISGRSNKGVEEWLRGLKNCSVIRGHARFASSATVVVNDEVLEAEKDLHQRWRPSPAASANLFTRFGTLSNNGPRPNSPRFALPLSLFVLSFEPFHVLGQRLQDCTEQRASRLYARFLLGSLRLFRWYRSKTTKQRTG
jgi:hypothetical protein